MNFIIYSMATITDLPYDLILEIMGRSTSFNPSTPWSRAARLQCTELSHLVSWPSCIRCHGYNETKRRITLQLSATSPPLCLPWRLDSSSEELSNEKIATEKGEIIFLCKITDILKPYLFSALNVGLPTSPTMEMLPRTKLCIAYTTSSWRATTFTLSRVHWRRRKMVTISRPLFRRNLWLHIPCGATSERLRNTQKGLLGIQRWWRSNVPVHLRAWSKVFGAIQNVSSWRKKNLDLAATSSTIVPKTKTEGNEDRINSEVPKDRIPSAEGFLRVTVKTFDRSGRHVYKEIFVYAPFWERGEEFENSAGTDTDVDSDMESRYLHSGEDSHYEDPRWVLSISRELARD